MKLEFLCLLPPGDILRIFRATEKQFEYHSQFVNEQDPYNWNRKQFTLIKMEKPDPELLQPL